MLTNLLKKSFLAGLFILVYTTGSAQSIRSYGQIFSQNLKGGTAIFGNTSMNALTIFGTPDLTAMNETSNASNGVGGLGFTTYGNDGSDMEPAMIDAVVPTLTVFSSGSTWKYNNPNADQGTAWRTLAAPGTGWVSGTGSFGYGSSQTVTIPSGNRTNYFLKTVTIANPSLYSTFDFMFSYNDGGVIYVNGVEVKRSNMPSGTILYTTAASSNNTTINEAFSIPSSYFTAGNNVIAVEIHQRNANSSSCLFNLSLTATPFAPSNATSADLVLPGGTNTIKFARLYWGGRIDNTTAAVTDTLLKVKLRKGTSGAYSDFIAPASSFDQYAIGTTDKIYQSYVDIKDFIQTNGAGTYTVANVPVTAGSITGGGHYGGWCIIIAYENLAQPYNSVRIYDGYAQVFDNGTAAIQTVSLTGLNVPNNTLVASDAIMSTMVWEGDGNLSASASSPLGDYVKVNGTAVSNSVNPATNFWNGTISNSGAFVTTKNPNYSNQMGIDIDQMQVGTGYGILPNASSVSFEFGTEADQYFPSIFAFTIKMKDPVITLNKTVADASGDGVLQANEVITYTLAGASAGPGGAYNTYIVDSLPTNVTYVANSLMINSAPGFVTPTAQTDAQDADFAFKAINGTRSYVKYFIGTGATSTAGGQMNAGTSYNLSFKAKVGLIPGSVVNTAHLSSSSQAGDLFLDDASVIIAPAAGPPAPVTLIRFDATLLTDKESLLKWTTESELNNDHYEIERSDDGVHFVNRGRVAGNGTTAATHYYDFHDNLNTTAGIVYYRLKAVDLDTKYYYSKIVALRLKGNSNSNFIVFPNPFGDQLIVSLTMHKNVTAVFRIFSFDGKEVMNRSIPLQKGDNIVELKDLKNILPGNYLVEVNTGDEVFVQKILKGK